MRYCWRLKPPARVVCRVPNKPSIVVFMSIMEGPHIPFHTNAQSDFGYGDNYDRISSFTNQSPIGLSSNLAPNVMANADFVNVDFSRLAAFSSQSSNESALPSEPSGSTTYFLTQPWNDTNRLSYSTIIDNLTTDQSVQLRMVPPHFQSFLQGLSNYQDPREVYQYRDSSFSTG